MAEQLTIPNHWKDAKLTFICWGGGQLAISNAAFFSACDDLGLQPSKVYASSGGAFAASQRYVMGHTGAKLKRIGVEFDLLGITRLANLLGNTPAIISLKQFANHLCNYLPADLTFEEYSATNPVAVSFIASQRKYRKYRPVLLNKGNIIAALAAVLSGYRPSDIGVTL